MTGLLIIIAAFTLSFVLPVIIFSAPLTRARTLGFVALFIALAEVTFYFALTSST